MHVTKTLGIQNVKMVANQVGGAPPPMGIMLTVQSNAVVTTV